MRTLVSWFFYLLGVIFFLLILGGVYVYTTDMFGIRGFVTLMTAEAPVQEMVEVEKSAVTTPDTSVIQKQEQKQDAHPILSESQEAALESVGINPAAVPSSVTDAQKTCLINAVGETRANEIKAGSMPTVTEILKAKACF